jgi:hypothetical protein
MHCHVRNTPQVSKSAVFELANLQAQIIALVSAHVPKYTINANVPAKKSPCALTCCCSMHVAWVLEELCCAPQWPNVRALLQLQSNLRHQIQELVRLSKVLAQRGNVPTVRRQLADSSTEISWSHVTSVGVMSWR